MTIHYQDPDVTLHHGDCIDVLRELPDNSVHAVVTDPPYGLANTTAAQVAHTLTRWVSGERDYIPTGAGFMGKSWDAFVPPVAVWDECLRVLKPGGHALVFAGTRTHDLMTLGLRLAGFEIRDSITWLYGSGFPKSLDVGKAIDRAAGAEREVMGSRSTAKGRGGTGHDFLTENSRATVVDITAPATPDAQRWQGWGTAMKPAHEPVVCARKPHTDSDILARIGSQLEALEDACRQRVNSAGRSSAPTRHASPEARTGSAPASAATQHGGEPASRTATGEGGASSAATATSASEWTAETFLSTVTSWKACWAELSAATSTSTTSTMTSRTTDLTTLSFCLSQITRRVTARSTLEPGSWSSLASAADNLFAAGVLNSRSTLALSAIESVTEGTRPDSPDAAGSRPASEPIVVARKPLSGTVAQTVLAHGTGALNIDGCRVETSDALSGGRYADLPDLPDGDAYGSGINKPSRQEFTQPAGRWPANVVLDHSQAAELDRQSGMLTSGLYLPEHADNGKTAGAFGAMTGRERTVPTYGDSGGASRFFPTFRYEAKAPTLERPTYAREGETTLFSESVRKRCTLCGKQEVNMPGSACSCPEPDFQPDPSMVGRVAHPTVKPLDLMRWLVRLVTPPGGTVLEPFAGSGTTAEACVLEGFSCIAIEREVDYLPLIVQRLSKPLQTGFDFGEAL